VSSGVKIIIESCLLKKYLFVRNFLIEVFMSDRKKDEGWRAENPNRHKREININMLSASMFFEIDLKKKTNKDKIKRKYS
jgi:hypothetical protein